MLEFHHIGVLVDDIEMSLCAYRGLFGNHDVQGPYQIESQGVRVCFLKMDQGYLEFVEATAKSTMLEKFRARKATYYHVGYLTPQVSHAIEALCQRDYKLVSTFASEAFAGRTCAFLFSPEMHLVELIEKPAA